MGEKTIGEKIRKGNSSSGAGGRSRGDSEEQKQKVEKVFIRGSVPMPDFISSNVEGFFFWKPSDQINLYCFLAVCRDGKKHPSFLSLHNPAVLMSDEKGFFPKTQRWRF